MPVDAVTRAPFGDRAPAAPDAGPARAKLIRSVALPSEHGGWSFLLEPIVLGLAVAPSLSGLLLGVGVLATFLTHQPLKTAIKDRLNGRRAFRSVVAERFAVLYGAVALLAVGLVVWRAGWDPLALALAAAPFAVAQLVWDARNKSRALGAEVCGAIALGAVGAVIAVVGGWQTAAAAGLWLVLAARAVPSIYYVRARLKLERKKPFPAAPTFVSHALAVAALAATSAVRFTPWLAVAAMVVLLARAAWGLSAYRSGRTPAAVGAQEVAFGLVTVVLVVIGYHT